MRGALARVMGGQGLAFGPFLINKTSSKLCSFPLFNAVSQQHMGGIGMARYLPIFPWLHPKWKAGQVKSGSDLSSPDTVVDTHFLPLA